MADIADTTVLSPEDRTEPIHIQKENRRPWSKIALGAIILLAIFMDFFQLGQNGYGNLYYASGVRSMMDSWHNFFFVSFDPGGFVTIDKPPIGFWIQTLSAKIFGFTPFSILAPQALCGVLTVVLLYYLVRRHFGVGAGLVAALALAVSPISVVTNRNNTIDSTLALALLLSAWAVIHAAETGKLRWLVLSAVFAGLGFNIKMAEAYLLLPALVLTYLLCAPRHILVRSWHILVFVVVLLVVSISWLAIVDLTPATQRPYVGSTRNNSELSLAFGYNGLGRLHIGLPGGSDTRSGRPGGGPRGRGTVFQANVTGAAGNVARLAQLAPVPLEAQADGPFHLFTPVLGGQIGWLLPFALLGIVALGWQRRLHFQRDRQRLGLVLWGIWLLTMTIFFTADASFHEYYLTVMAPGLCAMVGIGLSGMWWDYRRGGWRGWLLPFALALTAMVQVFLLSAYHAWAQRMSPALELLTVLVVFSLVLFRLKRSWNLRIRAISLAEIALGIGLFTLLITPMIWSLYTVTHNTESSFPTAGPSVQASTDGFTGLFPAAVKAASITSSTNAALIAFLEAHQGTTTFLVATPGSNTADPLILATNRPVMALGGYSGGDPILTVKQLQNLIQNHTIRYFLLTTPRATPAELKEIPEQFRDFLERGGNVGGVAGLAGPGANQSNVISWVSSNCSRVPSSAIAAAAHISKVNLGSNRLYDCSTRN